MSSVSVRIASAGGGWNGGSARTGMWNGDIGPAGVLLVVRSGLRGVSERPIGIVGK